jgi:Class III cytochrome C family/Cytochrome c7 and related cytochrome c
MTKNTAGNWWHSPCRRVPSWICSFVLRVVCTSAAVAIGQETKMGQLDPVAQPVPFSHKRHASAGLNCLDCHEGTRERDEAGLPQAKKCMFCHATIKSESPSIRKLAEAKKTGEKISWVRLYRVPDFVFFSHASHTAAGVGCVSCHGPVAKRDVLAQEVPTKMQTCVACHIERHASTSCVLCHQLGQ